MLDVKKEIKKYNSIDLSDSLDFNDEFREVFNSFTKTICKFDKEQYKISEKLEDVLSILEEDNDIFEKLDELEEKTEKLELENYDLINTMIKVIGLLEDIYRYVLVKDDEKWKEQIIMQWNKAKTLLKEKNIDIIEPTGDKFLVQLHKAVEIKENKEVSDGIILDTIKSGYIYNGQVIKKASVIVNSNK